MRGNAHRKNHIISSLKEDLQEAGDKVVMFAVSGLNLIETTHPHLFPTVFTFVL
jgi:hypothetical protein